MIKAEAIQQALHLISKSPAHYEYFFDSLKSPEWIQPLRDAGLFHTPPTPIQEGQYVSLPSWPESRYLVRMAPIAPEEVFATILEMPATENVRVHDDLVEAALALPTDLAAKLVDKMKAWIPSPYRIFLPIKLGKLMGHLAKGSQIDVALDLAYALLEVLPPVPIEKVGPETPPTPRFEEPRAQFDSWEYGQILKEDFPTLVEAAKLRAFDLICGLLDTATGFYVGQQNTSSSEDYSHTWRPSIRDEAHGLHVLRDILISGVINSAEQIAKSDPTQVRQIVEVLEAWHWLIFHRIAVEMLRMFPEAVPDLVVSHLTNRALFDDYHFENDFADLLQACFGKLPADKQQVILDWIEAGPDLEEFKDMVERHAGKRATVEEAEQYHKRWQRDHLAPIQAYLPASWKERYQSYVAEFGQPAPRRRRGFTVSWHGPDSPWPKDELLPMSVDAIVNLLNSWSPPDDFFAPSIEGVARILSEIVAAEPHRFAVDAEKFRGLDPTYVRALISGWREALKQNLSFDWVPVLALCKWVVNQPRDIPDRTPRRDADANWGETRQRIAELLSAGFENKSGQISFGLRAEVWEILEILSDDPDPTPEHEAVYGGSNMDPFTLSINTVRGEAMHSVVQYAFWVQRNLKDNQDQDAQGFVMMSEVQQVLEKHLDNSIECSLAVHSVYGNYFPWLVSLDSAWAAGHVKAIFPFEDEAIKLWSAAWEAYIVYCPPYDDTFALLGEQYALAVDRISLPSEEKSHPEHPRFRLAEHLMVLYGRGQLVLDSPSSLLAKFWRIAPASLRSHALSFIGRSLANSEEQVPDIVITRFVDLWEHRLKSLERGLMADNDPSELSSFGWWFILEVFDPAWALNQLYRSLKIVSETDPAHLVVEKLAKIAPQFSKESVQCLELLIKGDKNGWKIGLWRDSGKTVLAIALESHDESVMKSAEELINFLMSRGYFEFRDLLQRSN